MSKSVSEESNSVKILSMDTSSREVSIAISDSDRLLIEYNFQSEENLSAILLPLIDFLLNSVHLKIQDIDLFGIGVGPGIFTGIRMGMSTVKGFMFAQNKSVVPVTTLEALAYKHRHFTHPVVPLIDAKRGQVYCSAYHINDGIPVESVAPALIHIDELTERVELKDKINFVGSGALAYREQLKKQFPRGKCLIRSNFLASEMAKICYMKYSNGDVLTDENELIPFYLRKTDAEMNFEKTES